MTSHSTIRFGGVAQVLEELRDQVTDAIKGRLLERRGSGYNDLSDEETESISRIAGTLAKQHGANAVAEAYQMGVNRSIPPEAHERPTFRVTPEPDK